MPLTRLGGDFSIGADQRQFALERVLRGNEHAQRRALPRRERRGQDRELARVFADGGLDLSLCVNDREQERYSRGQQQCCDGGSELAR